LYGSIKSLFANVTQKHCRDFTVSCPQCAQYTAAPKEPHIKAILSTKPYERLVIDLKDFKHFTGEFLFRFLLTH